MQKVIKVKILLKTGFYRIRCKTLITIGEGQYCCHGAIPPNEPMSIYSCKYNIKVCRESDFDEILKLEVEDE